MIYGNTLGIILNNKAIWITKSELLTIAVSAFVIHLSIIAFQGWKEGKEQLPQVSLCEHFRINLSTIEVICFSLFIFLLC